MTVSTADVEYAIKDLGSTPEQVRDALVAAGVKGDQHSASSCPVANYLREHLSVDSVYVSPANVFVPGELADESTDVDVEPSDELVAFIQGFDTGLYPELIEP